MLSVALCLVALADVHLLPSGEGSVVPSLGLLWVTFVAQQLESLDLELLSLCSQPSGAMA